ncbi:MAG: hypothetical protein SV775_18530 [Thermodesulfobacteriota bacterium]|nr:hypothetical protein [Thermodesulfobacteriota bacterium]
MLDHCSSLLARDPDDLVGESIDPVAVGRAFDRVDSHIARREVRRGDRVVLRASAHRKTGTHYEE